MSKLGAYRNKNVYDYDSLTSAINASIDNDIFSVYWISGSNGKMFWKGHLIASVQSDRKGLHIVDFNEELWQPKKKEVPAPPPCVKEVKVTTTSTVETEELYDKEWYSKVVDELEKGWKELWVN